MSILTVFYAQMLVISTSIMWIRKKMAQKFKYSKHQKIYPDSSVITIKILTNENNKLYMFCGPNGGLCQERDHGKKSASITF